MVSEANAKSLIETDKFPAMCKDGTMTIRKDYTRKRQHIGSR
jgi:hypothetical protein